MLTQARFSKRTFQLITIVYSTPEAVKISLGSLDFPNKVDFALAKGIHTQFFCQ
jgi:hypothetical protein